jgi:hypothetical protein
MARRRKTVDPFADLAKKIEILEREMSIQREALAKLRAMSARASVRLPAGSTLPARKTA